MANLRRRHHYRDPIHVPLTNAFLGLLFARQRNPTGTEVLIAVVIIYFFWQGCIR